MDCKKKMQMRKVERVRTKNNARMLTGRCIKCNRKINLLLGREKQEYVD